MLDPKAHSPAEEGLSSEKNTKNMESGPKPNPDPHALTVNELSAKTQLRDELMENLFSYLHVNKPSK